jgi:shikimate kinase
MKTIALVGMPGSGKSSVGRQLARKLAVPFVDSDTAIEHRLREPIRSFFAREGEQKFRDVEQEVIDTIIASPETGVLATGGGSVLREANRRLLREAATVVYLRCTPDELFRRLRRDTQRPLLQVRDPRAALHQLFRERDPIYSELADFIIDTGRPAVHALVGMVLMRLELAGCVDAARVPSAVDGSGPGVEPSSP